MVYEKQSWFMKYWPSLLSSIWKWLAFRLPVGLVAWCLIRVWENSVGKANVDAYFGEGDVPFNPETSNPTICKLYEDWEISQTEAE